MKLLHNVKISVFSHPDEDNESIKQALISFIPLDLEKEKIKITEQRAQSYDERTITIFEAILEKERHTKQFISYLKEKLEQEQKNLLLQQINSRLDDDLHFFIRFDKEKYLKDKALSITDSGNCFHVNLCIAAFPKKYDTAVKIVKDIFG